MESLPEDILIQMFGLFCFHCRHPGSFPNADSPDVLTNKRTLAHLCRTSKALCAVAQPILYHYYATGNLPKITNCYQGAWIHKRAEAPEEPDFLPQFLRTVAQRPDLASRVVTMQLVTDPIPPADYRADVQTIKSLKEAGAANGIPLGRDDDVSEWGKTGTYSWPHRWLITLALALTPKLRSLLLAIDGWAHMDYLEQSPDVKLPCLRTLGLICHNNDYHITEPKALYSAAPNLETIYACDAAGWSDHTYGLANLSSFERGQEYGLDLQNVRRLAIGDLIPSNLGSLLPCVPQLEDLEFYWNGYELELIDLFAYLEPVKTTLRRLCISFLPTWACGLPDSDSEMDPDYTLHWYEAPKVDYPPIESLSDFEKLEDLAIDCRSIYLEADTDRPYRLTQFLPRTIRHLRISYLFRGMALSLSALASAAPRDFPQLKKVTIGVAWRTKPQYRKEIEQTKGLGGFFEASGITFSLEKDLVEPSPKTMIPGGTVGSRLVPLPSVLDKSWNL